MIVLTFCDAETVPGAGLFAGQRERAGDPTVRVDDLLGDAGLGAVGACAVHRVPEQAVGRRQDRERCREQQNTRSPTYLFHIVYTYLIMRA